jgi:hypothetical protein
MGWTTEESGFWSPDCSRYFTLLHSVKAELSPPGESDRATNVTLSSSTEVKNSWNYTSTSTHVFIVWCIIKRRDNFPFAIT